MRVIASREGYNGENIMITVVEESRVYVEMGEHKGWADVSYKIEKDGTYNQSVKDMDLPYIIIGKDIYSVNTFHTWGEDD